MTIDFNTMLGTDLGGQLYRVNRLSTPSSVELARQTWATVWLWYWKNEAGIWTKFGDTVGIFKPYLTENVTVKHITDIEISNMLYNYRQLCY